jgi:mono/diheme cytochrome c family protein
MYLANYLYQKIMRILNVFILYVACFLISNMSGNFQTYQNNKWSGIMTYATNGTSEKLQVDQTSGNQLYKKYCLTCHQEDGSGVRGNFPPFIGNEKITGPSNDLIRIVLFGLEGPIVVNGKDYNQPMPAQDNLNDKQIADVLSYIRYKWGNKASPILPKEVGKVRKLGKVKNS